MVDIYTSIPKKIKIIVNKGQDLQLFNPKKVIKHQPNKWRVLFLNVNEKMATAKVNSDNGNPEWLCEIVVTTKNVREPLSLLVTDSKGRHIGQVIIPLNEIPPLPADITPDIQPHLVFSNMKKSELEPTKKNAYPKGYLYYWIWTLEYWNSEEIVKMTTKKSLSKSISTLNIFRRKKSTASFQESEVYSKDTEVHSSRHLRASPLKIIKKKLKTGSNSSSSVNPQTVNQLGFKEVSSVNNDFHSTNPFDALMSNDISTQESLYSSTSYNNQRSLPQQVSISPKESPVSNKKKGLLSILGFKKSLSSADLSKLYSEKDHLTIPYLIPQTLGKQNGQRYLDEAYVISKTNERTSILNQPLPCMVHIRNQSINNQNFILNYNGNLNTLNQNSNLYKEINKELSNKSYEDMSKRELIDLVTTLGNRLNQTSEKCKSTEKQFERLTLEKKNLQEDLIVVKDELCRLKLRLLEAGDTKYLEKNEQKG